MKEMRFYNLSHARKENAEGILPKSFIGVEGGINTAAGQRLSKIRVPNAVRSGKIKYRLC